MLTRGFGMSTSFFLPRCDIFYLVQYRILVI